MEEGTGIERVWKDRISSWEDIPDTVAIRKTVFVNECKWTPDTELDYDDFKSPHLILYLDKKAVGTARLIYKEGKCYYSRIAVLKEFRGKGLGKILIDELEKRAKSEGAKEVYLEAQVSALGFYEKLGFKSYGDVYVEDAIDHKMMKKDLNK